MLLTLCKHCQYCLETMYWNCCEERFCFDKKIATYRLEDVHVQSNGHVNTGASLESVVTSQPLNNNHPVHANGREISELPVNANRLYEVFSKSMIFRDDHELKSKSSNDSLDELETKSEPDYYADKPNRTKVYFEDEVNSPVTDFEIMFSDELFAKHDMFNIEEEEESDKKSFDMDDGLTLNVEVKKQDIIKPTTVTIKDEPKITTQTPIFQYDPTRSAALPSIVTLPRSESLKGILRQSKEMPRSFSAKTLARESSTTKIPKLSRVESLKAMDTDRLNRVLTRIPQRSASFLNIPEHLLPEKPPLTKSKSALTMATANDVDAKLSKLPDTPIIKSVNLPKFFTDSPIIQEYKGETSLQSIKQQSSLMVHENDFSMPRYYGRIPSPVEPVPVHESKSMPDLRNPTSTGKVSKRLVKIRSKLKPLVIKKGRNDYEE